MLQMLCIVCATLIERPNSHGTQLDILSNVKCN